MNSFNYMSYANKPAPSRAERDEQLLKAWSDLQASVDPSSLTALRDSNAPEALNNFVPYRQEEFHRRLAKRFMPTDGQAS